MRMAQLGKTFRAAGLNLIRFWEYLSTARLAVPPTFSLGNCSKKIGPQAARKSKVNVNF